jgi:hypothetical protein
MATPWVGWRTVVWSNAHCGKNLRCPTGADGFIEPNKNGKINFTYMDQIPYPEGLRVCWLFIFKVTEPSLLCSLSPAEFDQVGSNHRSAWYFSTKERLKGFPLVLKALSHLLLLGTSVPKSVKDFTFGTEEPR